MPAISFPTSPAGVIRLLQSHTATQGNTTVFTYLSDAGDQVATITYQALDRATLALATSLLRCSGGSSSSSSSSGGDSTSSSSSSSSSSAVPSSTTTPLLRRGDRVILVYLPSLEFIVAFLACLRAGLVAVPVYPPDPRNLRVNIAQFASVVQSSGAKVALSHSSYTNAASLSSLKDSALNLLRIRSTSSSGGGAGGTSASSSNSSRNIDVSSATSPVQWPELKWLRTDLLGTLADAPKALPPSTTATTDGLLDSATPSDIAFLQYTSGSTSEPKGVMVTHGSLAHNLHTIVSSLRANTKTIVVSWLPQYHDMGLIGSFLGIVACGGKGIYMSPLAFIKKPVGWLQIIDKYRATHIQAPNFAYTLAARKFRDMIGASGGTAAAKVKLDLSCLQHCFNAAEPVTAVAIADFTRTFEPYGFKASAMAPGYGLAEHTVYVCDGGTAAIVADRQQLEANRIVHVLETIELRDLSLVPRSRLLPDKSSSILVSCGPVYPYSAAFSHENNNNNSSSSSSSGRNLTDTADETAVSATGKRRSSSNGSSRRSSGVNNLSSSSQSSPSSSIMPKNADIIVLIVDPETRKVERDPGAVGEIWISSPSVAGGYFGRTDASQETFCATLAGEDQQQQQRDDDGEEQRNGEDGEKAVRGKDEEKEDTSTTITPNNNLGTHRGTRKTSQMRLRNPDMDKILQRTMIADTSSSSSFSTIETASPRLRFLRTGDLGFIHARGELFIAGRLKDLLILRGRNFYPQDVEQVAEATDHRIRPGSTAVFATLGSKEEIVLAAEVKQEVLQGLQAGSANLTAVLTEIADTLRSCIMRDFGLPLAAVVLLKPHGIRKTTSGKVARAWNARAYEGMESGDPKSPWLVNNSAVVLTVLKKTIFSEEMDEEEGNQDEKESQSTTSSTRRQNEQNSTSARKATTSTTALASINSEQNDTSHPPPPPLFGAIEGPKLLSYLKHDIAEFLGLPPGGGGGAAAAGNDISGSGGAGGAIPAPPVLTAATLPTSLSLLHLGLDSLGLMQLQGKLSAEYGIQIPDEVMYSDETTLNWIVANVRELRKPLVMREGEIASAGDASVVNGSVTSNVNVPVLQQSGVTSISEGTHQTSNYNDTHAAPLSENAVEIADPEALMREYRRMRAEAGGGSGGGKRKGPTFCELNCPCFLWCCGE